MFYNFLFYDVLWYVTLCLFIHFDCTEFDCKLGGVSYTSPIHAVSILIVFLLRDTLKMVTACARAHFALIRIIRDLRTADGMSSHMNCVMTPESTVTSSFHCDPNNNFSFWGFSTACSCGLLTTFRNSSRSHLPFRLPQASHFPPR